MGFFGNFCACLTHYGNGVAPIYYGAGFVNQGTWWRINFQMSIVYIAVWLVIGLAWWKIIGLL